MEVSGQLSALAALFLGKSSRYLYGRRLGEPQSQCTVVFGKKIFTYSVNTLLL
jgi:hypothetical protein